MARSKQVGAPSRLCHPHETQLSPRVETRNQAVTHAAGGPQKPPVVLISARTGRRHRPPCDPPEAAPAGIVCARHPAKRVTQGAWREGHADSIRRHGTVRNRDSAGTVPAETQARVTRSGDCCRTDCSARMPRSQTGHTPDAPNYVSHDGGCARAAPSPEGAALRVQHDVRGSMSVQVTEARRPYNRRCVRVRGARGAGGEGVGAARHLSDAQVRLDARILLRSDGESGPRRVSASRRFSTK